ncbi:hypothetical protein MW871_09855 [Flavobacterium sp. I-SCBP12n]|uniref:Uncharacterized protein n=2 Tax=Flavobacterium TaxID=237 RepID=A0A9X2BLV5_9FLAO|nr:MULTISPECIES: hypothetical protein [Flavobacterium]MBP4140786.1 hypothetical protein [Flavobacterium flabelliforme]MCK8142193.1 hypothetical protein [Flavobacterium pygoscelis]
MKKITLKRNFWIFAFMFCMVQSYAQVGIGTITPNASAMLDVSSTTKGMLTPRMTTAQRLAITSPAPADGLIVYDITLKSFYYYNTTTSSWNRVNSDVNGRSKFKRIKSIADLAPEKVGSTYVLATDTYYEVNGTIIVDFPIDINNAYLVGLDANEDRLIKNSGTLFQGTQGGTIKNITISKAAGTLQVFNLTGDATGTPLVGTQNLIVRDCIIAGCNSVGTISGFNLVFFAVVQYASNTTGITYSNVAQLLLSNIGWFGNNSGTFETFSGSFNLLQKLGGFSDVKSGAIGVDVSSNPTINSDAVMESVVFTGASTQYVNPYTLGTYSGYNFNNSWNVRSAGIPNETDADAGGGFSMDYGVGTGISVSTNNSNPSNIVKVGTGTTISPTSNLFRFSSDSPNRLRYLGKKKRIFQVSGSISIQVPGAATYIVYLAKNGTAVTQYKVYGRGQVANDILVLPMNANIELNNNDYIEVFIQRFTGVTGDPIVPNLTIIVR